MMTWAYCPGGSSGPVAVPIVSAVSPNVGDTAGGGSFVTITVNDSTGCTGGSLGGVALTSFAIVDGTHVKGIPGAHAVGAVAAVVTNTVGPSTTGGTPFEYWTPAQITGVDIYLDANKGVTASAGAVGTWADQSANARSFTQGTGANKPTQVANVFGNANLPSINFTGGAQWLAMAPIPIAAGGAGRSYFAVMKQASSATRTTPAVAGVGNAPYQIIGDRVNGYGGLGMANGVIWDNYYTGAYFTTSRGSSLNDGNPHLVGSTDDATTNVKVYLGAAQQGATNTNAAILTGSTYDTIGLGFSTGDGFVGDIAAVVIVAGVIASGDLTKLNSWSKQRWATT